MARAHAKARTARAKPGAKARAKPQAKAEPDAKAKNVGGGRSPLDAIAAALRTVALGYPGAIEDTPWGERVAKVRGKIFFVCNARRGPLYCTAKLPRSRDLALSLPFAEPTGYGLGKSGRVTARFERARDVPVDMLCAWVDESDRAIAPKTLVKQL